MSTKKGSKNDEEDARFAQLAWDPKFRHISAKQRKVLVDDRFSAMFNKKSSFVLNQKTDKYGRKLKNNNATDELKRYYQLDEHEDQIDELQQLNHAQQEDDREIRLDLARGEGNVTSSSEDSDSDDEDDAKVNDQIVHVWGEPDADARRVENPDITHRLALLNCDWDRVSAQDIYILLQSFAPEGGKINSVSIYLSKFGKERIEIEKVSGPIDLLDESNDSASDYGTDDEQSRNMSEQSDDEDQLKPIGQLQPGMKIEDSDDRKINKKLNEKIRKYELQRLKYYYAIVEVSSTAVADKLYLECDGLEWETSGTILDLRIVENSKTFDNADIVDTFTNDENKSSQYEPLYFTNTALQQSRVNLTWEGKDLRRANILEKIKTQAQNENINEETLKGIVAMSDSDSDDTLKPRANLLKLAASSNQADPFAKGKAEHDSTKMEFSWQSNLHSSNTPNKPTVSKTKQKKLDKRKKNEVALNKKREDEAMSSLLNDEIKDNAIKKFSMKVDDSRFNAIVDNPDFNIDPSNPNFKKTEAMEKLISSKRERKSKKRRIEELSIVAKPATKEVKLSTKDLISKLQARSAIIEAKKRKCEKH